MYLTDMLSFVRIHVISKPLRGQDGVRSYIISVQQLVYSSTPRLEKFVLEGDTDLNADAIALDMVIRNCMQLSIQFKIKLTNTPWINNIILCEKIVVLHIL
jgi:hypothetical protein